MTPYTAQIADLLQRFRAGCREEAFFGLLEMDHEALPELMAALRAEQDTQTRAFVVEVVWQHRRHSAIPFLEEALRDSEPVVWREALDGLVALASPAARETLRSARARRFPNARDTAKLRHWLEEAIAQAESGTPDG